jgi:hypothetical protein
MTSLSLIPEHPVDSQSSRGPGTAVPLRPGPGSVQQDEPPAPRPPPRRSSQEIANLESAEAALDAMVVSYHKDRAGRKLYETMLDSWKSDELRLVADRVGTINAKGANCSKVMRDALRTAIESHAEKNPHLLVNQEDAPIQLNTEVAVAVDSDDDDSVEQKESDRRRVPKPRQVKEKKKPALSANVLAAMGRIPSSPRRVGGRRHPSTPASKALPSPRTQRGKPASARKLFADKDSSSSSEDSEPSDDEESEFGDEQSYRTDTDSESDEGAPVPQPRPPSSSRVPKSTQRAQARVVAALASHGIIDPMAPGFIANALRTSGGQGSLTHVFTNEVLIESKRNRMEIIALARVIDACRSGEVELAMELAVRRLAGVHTAELTGSWAICAQYELDRTKQSFVPASLMTAAIKDVLRLETLTKASERKPKSSSESAKKPRTDHTVTNPPGGAGGQTKSTRPPRK